MSKSGVIVSSSLRIFADASVQGEGTSAAAGMSESARHIKPASSLDSSNRATPGVPCRFMDSRCGNQMSASLKWVCDGMLITRGVTLMTCAHLECEFEFKVEVSLIVLLLSKAEDAYLSYLVSRLGPGVRACFWI
jgi:hypothetical protein